MREKQFNGRRMNDEALRDVEGERHGRAQQDDIAPEGQEAPVSSAEAASNRRENFNIWGN